MNDVIAPNPFCRLKAASYEEALSDGYKGWKVSRPHACTFDFAHVLNLSALGLALLLYKVCRRGQKHAPVDMDFSE